MDFLEALRKDVNSRVLRVLLKRPHNGIKPSDLRSELNLTPSCGTKTRRDGLSVAFLKNKFEANLAEFNKLNEATLKKHNIEVVHLSKRVFNVVATYLEVLDKDQEALFKTTMNCDKVYRHTVKGIETSDMVASYSSIDQIPQSIRHYLAAEERNSSSAVYAQNFCIKCREIVAEQGCTTCSATNTHANKQTKSKAPSAKAPIPKRASAKPSSEITTHKTTAPPPAPQLPAAKSKSCSPLLIRTPSPSPTLEDIVASLPQSQSPILVDTIPSSYADDDLLPSDFEINETAPEDRDNNAALPTDDKDCNPPLKDVISIPSDEESQGEERSSAKKSRKKRDNTLITPSRNTDSLFKPSSSKKSDSNSSKPYTRNNAKQDRKNGLSPKLTDPGPE
ncbi:MAG: hypothetical protein F9K49_06065 [Caedimonadaceae bacterium]|nr:MAG: hypothetical protein F9K49_06065 [Caedimonadaceae bacterium]